MANFFPSNALNRSGQAPTIVKTLHQRTFLVMIWCVFESIVNLESLKDGNSINMKQYCTSMKQFELQALNLHVALISCFAANFRTEFVGSTATCVEKVDHSRLEKSTRTAPVTRSPHLHAVKHVLVRALDNYPFPCYEGLLPKSVYSNASPRKGRIQGALQLADRVVDNRPSLQIGFWGFLAVLAEYEIFSRNSFAVYVFIPHAHFTHLSWSVVSILPFSTVEEQAGCKVATTLTFQQVCHIHCWSHVLAQRLVLAFCRFSCWPWESSAASLVSSLTAWIAMVLVVVDHGLLLNLCNRGDTLWSKSDVYSKHVWHVSTFNITWWYQIMTWSCHYVATVSFQVFHPSQGFHQLLLHHQSCGQPSNICVSCTWKLPMGGRLRGAAAVRAAGHWKLLNNHHRCNRRCCTFLGFVGIPIGSGENWWPCTSWHCRHDFTYIMIIISYTVFLYNVLCYLIQYYAHTQCKDLHK